VGGVRRDTAQDDVVFETEFSDFEGFMRPEAVAYQYPWFLVRPFFGLGVEHKLEPLQADIGVSISTVGVRMMPSRSGLRDPVGSMS